MQNDKLALLIFATNDESSWDVRTGWELWLIWFSGKIDPGVQRLLKLAKFYEAASKLPAKWQWQPNHVRSLFLSRFIFPSAGRHWVVLIISAGQPRSTGKGCCASPGVMRRQVRLYPPA